MHLRRSIIVPFPWPPNSPVPPQHQCCVRCNSTSICTNGFSHCKGLQKCKDGVGRAEEATQEVAAPPQWVHSTAALPVPTAPCRGWELLRAPHQGSAARRGCLGLRPWGGRHPAWLGSLGRSPSPQGLGCSSHLSLGEHGPHFI